METQDILDAREQRAAFQKQVVLEYKRPLLVLRINYPGLEKNTPVTRGIFRVIADVLERDLDAKIHFNRAKVTAEGPLMTLAVDKDPIELKRIAMKIEKSHPLGRYVDLDVYDLEAKSVDREVMGEEPRKCFVCSLPAHQCTRNGAHSHKILIDHIHKQYELYLEELLPSF